LVSGRTNGKPAQQAIGQRGAQRKRLPKPSHQPHTSAVARTVRGFREPPPASLFRVSHDDDRRLSRNNLYTASVFSTEVTSCRMQRADAVPGCRFCIASKPGIIEPF
jgi:hypothetical protein